MSDAQKSGVSISPWWGLLLIPAALLVGKLIGGAPVPPAANHATSNTATSAPLSVQSQGRAPDVTSHASGDEFAPAAGTEPPAEPPAVSGGGVQWMAMGDAMEESQRTGKPILLDFTAEWCPACQAMKLGAFDNAGVARAVEAAVLPVPVVDRVREDGANSPGVQELKERFDIHAFPTLVVVNPATGKATKIEGYPGGAQTRDWIVQAAAAMR